MILNYNIWMICSRCWNNRNLRINQSNNNYNTLTSYRINYKLYNSNVNKNYINNNTWMAQQHRSKERKQIYSINKYRTINNNLIIYNKLWSMIIIMMKAKCTHPNYNKSVINKTRWNNIHNKETEILCWKTKAQNRMKSDMINNNNKDYNNSNQVSMLHRMRDYSQNIMNDTETELMSAQIE